MESEEPTHRSDQKMQVRQNLNGANSLDEHFPRMHMELTQNPALSPKDKEKDLTEGVAQAFQTGKEAQGLVLRNPLGRRAKANLWALPPTRFECMIQGVRRKPTWSAKKLKES